MIPIDDATLEKLYAFYPKLMGLNYNVVGSYGVGVSDCHIVYGQPVLRTMLDELEGMGYWWELDPGMVTISMPHSEARAFIGDSPEHAVCKCLLWLETSKEVKEWIAKTVKRWEEMRKDE